MHVVIDAGVLKHIVASLYGFKEEAVFRFDKEKVILHQLNESHTAMIHLELPRSVFKEYDSGVEVVKVSVKDLKSYLAGPLKEGTLIDLSCDLKKEPKVNVGIRSVTGFRKFGTPSIALEEEDKDVRDPMLGLNEVTAKVDAVALKQGVEDAGKVDVNCFVEARRKPDRFVVWAMKEGTFQSSWNEMALDMALFELNIVEDQVRSSYSVENMLDCIRAGLFFSEVCVVNFSRDWSIRLGFELPFEGDLHFWIAPLIQKG